MANLFKFGFSSSKKSESDDTKTKKGREETKRDYEKNVRKRGFLSKWKEDFPWLEYDESAGLMKCQACTKYSPSSASSFVIGTDTFRLGNIQSHASSASHITAEKKFEIELKKMKKETIFCSYSGDIETSSSSSSSSLNVSCQPEVIGALDIAIRKLNESQRQKIEVCFNTAYFVAKNELPFTLYPRILDLQTKNGVELPNSYRSDQACRRFMKYIYDDLKTDPNNLLKNANVFSIMFDGATDVSVCENEIVYARVIQDGIPKNIFIKNEAVEHANAQGVLDAIERSLASVDSEWQWKEKLIATGSDGASVNLGKHNSVTALLKREIPYLLPVHCANHRLELGALDAMKARDAKMFSDLKSVLLNLHKHYHYSAKAMRELKMIAEAMEEKMLRPVNLEGTRWMPHLSKSLEVLLKSYKVIVSHFEDTVESRKGSADVQGRAKLVLRHLKDYSLLYYMHFLKDVLSVLSELSFQFQKDSCTLPDAVDGIETACLQLVALQQRPGDALQSFMDSVDDDNKFYGVQLSPIPPGITPDHLKSKCRNLIETVIDHISKRIGDLDSSELLKHMQIFYPVNLPETDVALAVYGENEIDGLSMYFAPVLDRLGCDIEHMQHQEWPALKTYMKRNGVGVDPETFYHRIFVSQNLKDKFVNILKLVEIILCIPVSSAICERGFSARGDFQQWLESNLIGGPISHLKCLTH